MKQGKGHTNTLKPQKSVGYASYYLFNLAKVAVFSLFNSQYMMSHTDAKGSVATYQLPFAKCIDYFLVITKPKQS